MLAKALANEAGVPFYYISAASLDAPIVGTGARTLRNLFSSIQLPAIVFIDEIDSMGNRSNDTFNTRHHHQSLNQLLTLVDGFKSNSGLLLIGATNLLSGLDPALTRSGRFDRAIHVALPTFEERKMMWTYYLNKVRHQAGKVNFEVLARVSVGLSGGNSKIIQKI